MLCNRKYIKKLERNVKYHHTTLGVIALIYASLRYVVNVGIISCGKLVFGVTSYPEAF